MMALSRAAGSVLGGRAACSAVGRALYGKSRLVSAQAQSREANSLLQLSSSEALGALRPFYFAVHPDRFSQFPIQKAANEESLKQLNSYLDALQPNTTKNPQPVQLTFYIHPSTISGRPLSRDLQQVSLRLHSLSVGSTVLDILDSCNLSTLISDSILTKLTHIKTSDRYAHHHTDQGSTSRTHSSVTSDFDDFETLFMRRPHSRKPPPVFLDKWLLENLPRARNLSNASALIHEENARITSAVCREFDLKRVSFLSQLTATAARGHLKSLTRFLKREREVVRKCGKGVEVVLGNASFVDMSGSVHLNCEETLQQWSEFLPSAVQRVRLSHESTAMEKHLSAILGGVTFDRSSSQLSCEEYHQRLQQLMRENQGFALPHSHVPRPFEGVSVSLTRCHFREFCQHCLPSIAATGVVLVPVSSSSSSSSCLHGVLKFLEVFHLQARHKRAEHQRREQRVSDIISRCKERLKLEELGRSLLLTNSQICQSCESLLSLTSAQSKLGNTSNSLLASFEGQHLHVGSYYSVTADGQIRIPWNFITSVSESGSV